MTIQRLYSLPNCKLVLEGLSDVVSEDVTRPLLSILVNAECHFTGYEQPLSGGRDFLEDLVSVVSSYAQEFLSGIHRPHREGNSTVQLQRVGDNLHRLTVQPAAAHHNLAAPGQIDLVTVQLFDLVEAIDQLFADSQTLPDLTLNLAPLSKRYVASSEPVTQRAVPAAIGASSLAAAAALFFLLPVPQVRRPQPAASSPTPAASPTVAASSPPVTPSASSAASPSPSATPSTASPSPSAAATSSTPTASPSASTPLDQAQLDTLLNSAPEVTNEADLGKLTLQLRDQLDQAWKQTPRFSEPLVYRVGVAQNGDILGFKYVNDASIAHVNETPLLDLRYNSTAPTSEPIAQFRVVFTPSGVVQVSPWHGEPAQP